MLDITLFTGETYRGIIWEQTPDLTYGLMRLILANTNHIKEIPNRIIKSVRKVNGLMTKELLADIGRPSYYWNPKVNCYCYSIPENLSF